MEKFSIFGASGFIGSRFCELYPNETIKIERNSRIPESNNIINFISTTDNYAFRKDMFVDIEANINVMLEILISANYLYGKDFTFNQISTWSVYGDTDLPAIETAVCNPTGFYSITKRTAEQILATFCELYGAKYHIFRLCNVLGEGDAVTETKNSIQYLIGKLKNNEDITLYNNGDFIREYMYVDDACDGIYLGATKGEDNEIYNIGTGKPSNYGDLIKYCKERLNSSSKINYINTPIAQGSVQAKNMFLNVEKINRLGFLPKYSDYGALENVMAGHKLWDWEYKW